MAHGNHWFVDPPAGWLLAFTVAVAAGCACYLSYRLGRALGQRRGTRRAREGSRRALAGRVAEQWAPYLEGFPGRPTEARFLGAPVDYLVFRGLDEGRVDEVLFVEVKSGAGELSGVERALRACIDQGRVRFVEHRVPAPDEQR